MGLSRGALRRRADGLSYPLEAAHANFADRPNLWIAQANIGGVPFKPGGFDAIFSIGVLHHTPDIRAYLLKLVPLLKPDGEIAIWVYAQGLGVENDILDTLDGYSPRYHGIHSPEEVMGWFKDAGLEDVRAPSGWTTSMRGTLRTTAAP